ncbi:MAG: hypothetical protein HYX37_16695 [Rhizobiales bacterium]|nr:hypothetical protein [Hyphomicrobiales bacterium]
MARETITAPFGEAVRISELESTVKRRAARLGKSVDELLADDRKAIHLSTYPSVDCLDPWEVEQFCLGNLLLERISHAQSCPMCAAMLEVANSSELPIDAFMREVAAARPILNARDRTAAFRDPLWDIVAVTAPILILCIIAAAIIAVTPDVILSISISSLKWTSLTTVSAAIAVALIVFLSGMTAAKWFGAQRSFQKIGGAVIGGLFATFTVGYGAFFTWHVTSNYRGLQSAEDRVLRIVASQINDGSNRTSVVRYSPDSKSLAGTLVAVPGQNYVNMYWDHGKRTSLGTAYLGYIAQRSDGKIAVRAANQMIEVNAPIYQSQQIERGDTVFAFVPSNTDKASKIFSIDELARKGSQQ